MRLTPLRRRGYEFIDDPNTAADAVARSLDDVACANALFGGTRAVAVEVARALREIPGPRVTLLDVGTGAGDIPAHLRGALARRGVGLTTYGVEANEVLARGACRAELPMVRADARALPFASRSIDIVMCSQVLHHFERDDGLALLRELDRVARHRVIVSDIRRSWLAVAGIWIASFPLRFHPISRHDGVVSVLRGFTRHELREMVETAVGRVPEARHRMGFRTTASWRPAPCTT